MSVSRFIEQGENGCGGFFRGVNCGNRLEMLQSVLSDTEEERARSKRFHEAAAQTASLIRFGLTEEAQTSKDIDLTHYADRCEALVEELGQNVIDCRVMCPGIKRSSSLCQALLVYVRPNGGITEV